MSPTDKQQASHFSGGTIQRKELTEQVLLMLYACLSLIGCTWNGWWFGR